MQDLKNYLLERHTEGSAKRYLHAIERFISATPQSELAHYTEVTNYLGTLRKAGASPSAMNVSLSAIKRYYDWILERNIREDHPCKYLKLKDKRHADIQL